MANQHDGALRTACMAGCKRPEGFNTGTLPQYTRHQVGRMMQKLCAAGKAFRAPTGGKEGRYFDTKARAEEFANRVAGERFVPITQHQKKSAWDKAAPWVMPEGLEIVELPSTIQPRHHVEPDKVPPLFSSLRPGQYIDTAPRTWVQAAVGAA